MRTIGFALLAAIVVSSPGRLRPSAFPTAAFAPDGALWVVWVDGPGVYVGSSRDLGKTFSTTTPVTTEPEAVDANGEARPKIALGPKGEIYVSYTRKGQQPYTGDIRFSRRLVDGRFSPPITVNDDGLVTGHRFDTLSVSPGGDIHLVWIDKRDLDAANQHHHDYAGAALYEAVSVDRGSTFSPNRKVKDEVCECCRIALAWDGDTPFILWRDVLEGGIRDHVMTALDAKQSTMARATDDGWKIAGCPHHGPALAIGADHTRHMAWFTGDGKRGPGLFYRRSTDGGRSLSDPMPFGGRGASHPAVLAAGKAVWLAWKETADGVTTVRAMRSADGGASWSAPREVVRTSGDSDHPFLLARGERDAFVSWFTGAEGYRLIPLD